MDRQSRKLAGSTTEVDLDKVAETLQQLRAASHRGIRESPVKRSHARVRAYDPVQYCEPKYREACQAASTDTLPVSAGSSNGAKKGACLKVNSNIPVSA